MKNFWGYRESKILMIYANYSYEIDFWNFLDSFLELGEYMIFLIKTRL